MSYRQPSYMSPDFPIEVIGKRDRNNQEGDDPHVFCNLFKKQFLLVNPFLLMGKRTSL